MFTVKFGHVWNIERSPYLKIYDRQFAYVLIRWDHADLVEILLMVYEYYAQRISPKKYPVPHPGLSESLCVDETYDDDFS